MAYQGPSSSNGVSVANENSSPRMKHNPDISTVWTPHEQGLLEESLQLFAHESNLTKYIKIAEILPEKTVRDVALRCRWMTKKEISKRRKERDNSTRKTKDKKERVTTARSSHLAVQPYASTSANLEKEDIFYTATFELIKENELLLNRIGASLTSGQMNNTVVDLLIKAQENFHNIENKLKDEPHIMKNMPPLPVKLMTINAQKQTWI